jgi:hypothetical protein
MKQYVILVFCALYTSRIVPSENIADDFPRIELLSIDDAPITENRCYYCTPWKEQDLGIARSKTFYAMFFSEDQQVPRIVIAPHEHLKSADCTSYNEELARFQPWLISSLLETFLGKLVDFYIPPDAEHHQIHLILRLENPYTYADRAANDKISFCDPCYLSHYPNHPESYKIRSLRVMKEMIYLLSKTLKDSGIPSSMQLSKYQKYKSLCTLSHPIESSSSESDDENSSNESEESSS